jgi:hypothetical protein
MCLFKRGRLVGLAMTLYIRLKIKGRVRPASWRYVSRVSAHFIVTMYSVLILSPIIQTTKNISSLF